MLKLLSILFLILGCDAQAMTIGAYNIRNFDYDERYRISTNKPELSHIIQGLGVDILSVEEINNTAAFESFVAKKLNDFDVELSRCGGLGKQHVGFIYNKTKIELLSFNEDLSTSNPGTEGACDTGSRPLAIALFQVRATKQRLYGITVHLKAGSDEDAVTKRKKQLAIIKSLISELKAKTGVKEYFVAGDFNTTNYLNKGVDYQMLTTFTNEANMVNHAQNLGCSAYWWGGTNDDIESPTLLDHVITTKGLIENKAGHAKVWGHCQKVNCQEAAKQDLGVSYESVSDHCPITVTF
jgi:endonuclease/exonuclease/phosphatase family metal-dependent hydrolase